MEETPIFEPLIPTHQDPESLKQAQSDPKLTIKGGTHDKEEQDQEGQGEESGRDRLKRYRVEMAGRVWIPDIWGQEEFMKDWSDCNAFDAALVRSKIMSARAALMEEEGSRRSLITSPNSIENRCN